MSKEKTSFKLFLCLFFIYTINVLGKTSFSAATVALVGDAILTKTEAGIISGVFWLLYAVGQFAGGFLTDKISPYVLIEITIVMSTIANFTLGFTENYALMLIIWSINGILQFGLWASILKLVSTEIIPKQRMMATERLAFCYCLGSILSYILATGALAFLNWKYIFLFCGIISGISWFCTIYAQRKLSPILEEEEKKEIVQKKSGKLTGRVVWESGLVFFCVLVIVKGVVDNGIKNWMPTIMSETYGASPSFTLLLTVGLLITNIFGVVLATYVYHKVKCDELVALRILYIAIVPMLLSLLNFRNMNIYIATILMSGVTILIYGSSQILLMNYPGRFHPMGLTATVGGIVNCFAAFGSVIATYGSGFIADNWGWDAIIVFWNVLILLFVVITIAIVPNWKKFRRR